MSATPEELDRQRGYAVRDQPNRDAKLSPEKIAELRRLFGEAR